METTIDANGKTRRENDDLGRQLKLIEDYQEDAAAHPDSNRTTEFAYDADGNMIRLTLRNAATGDQVTNWIYGTTLNDSEVATSNLLRAKIYPESDDTGDIAVPPHEQVPSIRAVQPVDH